ncbi:MAG: FAD-dependent oxidoreductase [Candidatus Campbellbacteria bacterium]|nr:FAD-dependent oxidoreductase [Candidatus Campbellbacteria bacterium]
MTYDVIIIGAGPGGTAAAVYSARKQLKTLLICKEFGGQSIVSEDIQNWIGTPSISGIALAKAFKDHVAKYADFVTIQEGVWVENIEHTEVGFTVKTNKETFSGRSLLITSGSTRRKLAVPGADTFENKGLTYCASCDGPLFSEQDVVVVGGGNAGFESAAQLLAYCKSVTILQHGDRYKADEITVAKVLAHPNVKGILNTEIVEVKGDKFVTGIVYEDTTTNEKHELPVTGIFVEIGLVPSTDFLGTLVEVDTYRRIKIDPWTQRASLLGVWAAGDCSNIKYHQNNIAAGDAVRAIEDLYLYLKTGK